MPKMRPICAGLKPNSRAIAGPAMPADCRSMPSKTAARIHSRIVTAPTRAAVPLSSLAVFPTRVPCCDWAERAIAEAPLYHLGGRRAQRSPRVCTKMFVGSRYRSVHRVFFSCLEAAATLTSQPVREQSSVTHILRIAALAACITPLAAVQAAGVPLELALEAAHTAISACKANGYNVTVTILDPDLSTRVVMRGDGAPDGTVQIAYRKAYTVIKTGMSSADFGKSVPAPPAPPAGAPPGPPGPVNGDADLITLASGLPIK